MRIHIAAGILAVALLAGGCGKFVRDELITMQNEIDRLYTQVEQANTGLKTLQDIVRTMAANGYITNVEKFVDEDGKGGHILSFRTVILDETGAVSSEDTYSIKLYSGVDGQDGEDAKPYVVSMKQDEEDGRWYWYSTQDEDWLQDENGNRFLVDGKTPQLKVEDGFWFISWDGKADDDEEKTWEETGWKAKGDDAYEWFSNAELFDDRLELTLAADGSVLVLPRLLPVDVVLTFNGESLEGGDIPIAPGETISIQYVLSGTGVENAILVAGTDGRLKTALRTESATEGTVEVTCPEEFPEGGYVYITVNDGNGRSIVRVIRFACRTIKLVYGDAENAAPAAGETKQLTFEANFEPEVSCLFPEGVEPWLTAKMEAAEGYYVLTYDVAANTAAESRSAVIVVSPKDHPGFETFRVTVTQAAAETGSGESGQ